jgi:PTH1 family peptidyl-tRNA hydrolase
MGQPARIILGLGNPGENYARTRHNIGFMLVDALAADCGADNWRREANSLVTQCEIAGMPVLLAKPLTYMNLSGHAAGALLESYGLPAEGLIVVLDEINLPFGAIRIRRRGSAGGHQGLLSILRFVGSEEVVRVRLGVGEDQVPVNMADFVLSDFPRGCDEELNRLLGTARDAVKAILADGPDKAMSAYNAVRQ